MYRVSENAENLTISNNIHLFDSPRCTNWILHGFSILQPHAPDWSINTCIKSSVFSIHMTVHTHMHLYTFTSTNIITQKEKCVSNKDQFIYNVSLEFKSKVSQLSKWMKTSKHFTTEDFKFLESQIMCGLQGYSSHSIATASNVTKVTIQFLFCFREDWYPFYINQYKGYILDYFLEPISTG